jgi:hypothetical protein
VECNAIVSFSDCLFLPNKKPTASYNAIGKKFLFQPGRQTGYVWRDNAEFVFTEYIFSVIVPSAVQKASSSPMWRELFPPELSL